MIKIGLLFFLRSVPKRLIVRFSVYNIELEALVAYFVIVNLVACEALGFSVIDNFFLIEMQEVQVILRGLRCGMFAQQHFPFGLANRSS